MISGVVNSQPTGFRFQTRRSGPSGTIPDSPPEPASPSRPLVVRARIKTDPEPRQGAVGLHMIHEATGLLDPIG